MIKLNLTLWICVLLGLLNIPDASLIGENVNGYSSVGDIFNKDAETAFSAGGHHHHIAKRSVAGITAPNITFELQKMGAFSSETQIKIGNRISFNVTMTVTVDGTTDLRIEILTESIKSNDSSESSAVLSICPPTVTSVGSNIAGVNASEVVGVMESTVNDGKYDRSVLYFGTLTRTQQGGSSEDDDKIIFLFDVVVNNHSAFTSGAAYWVSVGAQYHNKQNIWLGQAVFYGLTSSSLNSGLLPSFKLNGPSVLSKGSAGHWTIEITLKDAVNDVVVEVYSPVNISQILSICSISVGNTGDAFSCYGKSDAAKLTFPADNTSLPGTHRMASLDLGSVTNSMFWSSPAATGNDTTITLDVTATMLNVTEAFINETYWLAATVEVDKSTIWSAQIAVSPLEYDQTSEDNNIPSLVLYTPQDHLTWGSPTTFYINITIPSNSSNAYKVEFALPTNDTAVMMTCPNAVSVYYVGKNFPCWNYDNLEAVYQSEVNSTDQYDYVKLDLGFITNAGTGSSAEDNTIVVKLTAKVVENHTAIESGDSVSVIGGIQFGYRTIWVGQIEIKIWDNTTIPTDKIPKLSSFSLMNARDASFLYAKGTTSYGLKLDLPYGTFWPNIKINVEATTVDDIPAFDICSINVIQVGRDIPSNCVSTDRSNLLGGNLTAGEKTRVPRSNKYVTGSMSLNIPNVINGGYGNFWWNANDSIILFAVSLQDADHGLLTNKGFYWFNVTVDYGGSDVLKEDLYVQYINDTQPALSTTDTSLKYEIMVNGTTTDAARINSPRDAKVDVNVYTTPKTILGLRVEAYTQNDTISDENYFRNVPINGDPLFCNTRLFNRFHTESDKSIPSCMQEEAFACLHMCICRVRVKQKGVNIPCANPYRNAYKTYYGAASNVSCSDEPDSTKCVTNQVDHGILDLGNMANYGYLVRNSTNENDSLIVVEVVLQIHPNFTDTVNPGDTFSLVAGVYSGATQLWINDFTVTADSPTTIANLNVYPSISFAKLSTINNTQVTKGGAAVYVLSIYIPPGLTAKYRVEFFVPSNVTLKTLGKSTLCEAKVMSANWNLPCVNDTLYHHDRLSLDNGTTYDTAVIDLGYVTNAAEDDGTYELMSPENLMTIEAVVSIPLDGPATSIDYLWVAGTVKVNDDKIWASSNPISVTESILDIESTNDTLDFLIEEEDSNPVVPGGRKRFHISLYTDMMTNNFSMNFIFPNDGQETYLTLQHLHISHIGKNFACPNKDQLKVEYINSLSSKTSQDENVEVQLGLFTNVGTSRRYQFADYEYLDDAITLSFDIIPSDHAAVTNMSVHSFTVSVTDSNGRTKTVTDNVTVSKTESEKPELQIVQFVLSDEDTEKSYTQIIPGTKVSTIIHFNHTWESSKHGYNVVLRFFLPDALDYSSYGGLKYMTPVQAFDSQKRILSFTIQEMFFSDNETFYVNFTIDPSKSIHVGSGKIHFVIPMDITYDDSFKTNMSIVEFDVFVPDCSTPLGIESRGIKDCQIKSSVSPFIPGHVRLNSGYGWNNKPRSSPFQRNEYLQINFGNKTRITNIVLQPATNDTNFIQTFALQYSLEGKKWYDYVANGTNTAKIFNISELYSNIEQLSEVNVSLTEDSLETGYLRFIPRDSVNGSNLIGFRIEIKGCVITTNVPLSDVCTTDTSLPLYERGYLLNKNDGNLYVCMISNIDDYIKCSYTSDLGETWNAIPDSVVNVNFVQSNTNMLYGVARNRKSRMRSADGGENWCAVSEEEYTSVESDTNNVIKVKHLPFDSWPLDLDTLYSEFGWTLNASLKWTADMNGVHVWTSASGSWKVVSYWFSEIWRDSQ